MTHFSMTLTKLESFKSIFSINKVEIGLALRKSFVLFGAVGVQRARGEAQGAAASAALLTSPLFIICLSCPTVTQVTHGSPRGAETEETSHGLEQSALFVYAGKLKCFKVLSECFFKPILEILW